MKIERYLQRIGYEGSVEPTLETLVALHRAHLRAIPYENLDIHRGGRLSLELPQIYEKIVEQRRGGWCYEMNGLFGWALRELGFDVTLLASNVVPEHSSDGSEGNHLILRVDLDRPYLADVGFGNGFPEPLPLEPGTYQQGYRTYQLMLTDVGWFFRNYPNGGPGYDFSLTPRQMSHFENQCHTLQTSPESGFVRATVCQRFTPDGIVALRGAVLRTLTGQGTEQQIVENAATFEQVLNSVFDLHLPHDEIAPLWEKVWARHLVWLQENP